MKMPTYKIQVTFPLWLVDNLEGENDIEVIREKLLSVTKEFVKRDGEYLRNNIAFDFIDDDEELPEEDDAVLISGDYIKFLETAMDGGLIPPLPGYKPRSLRDKNKKKRKK
jgi:hypothetical protein